MATNNPENYVLAGVFNNCKTLYLKVFGRGTHEEAAGVKKFISKVFQQNGAELVLFDLSQCESMDSTFMGLMAGTQIEQLSKYGKKNAWAVRVQEHCKKLLKNLGLSHLYEVYDTAPGCIDKIDEGKLFLVSDDDEIGHYERLLLMIESHEILSGLSDENKEEFKVLLEVLEQQKKAMEEEMKDKESGDATSSG